MELSGLLQLLQHWDDDCAAQAVEMAVSLDEQSRLRLASDILTEPWPPGAPWRAIRICSHTAAQADAGLRQWLVACARLAVARLPDTPCWTSLLTAMERSGHDTRALTQALSSARQRVEQWREPHRTTYVTCGRAAIAAGEALQEGDRERALMPWLLIRRYLGAAEQDWGRQQLLRLCRAQLDAQSTSRRKPPLEDEDASGSSSGATSGSGAIG